jgi:DNA polymerase-3 subunit delta'
VDVRTHADLCSLMPETLALELNWPLDEKTQKELDDKKRKPSKEIRVEAAREMVAFSQFTRSGGSTKVVFVYPAERMNHITANTILKTLEEPPGECRFVLASEAAHQLLPTIRSRCQTHTMVWPTEAESLSWLQTQGVPAADAVAAGGEPAGGAAVAPPAGASRQAPDLGRQDGGTRSGQRGAKGQGLGRQFRRHAHGVSGRQPRLHVGVNGLDDQHVHRRRRQCVMEVT